MNKDILNFFLKLSESEELKKQFLNKPLEERYQLALKNSEHPFSEEEFIECIEELFKRIYNESKKGKTVPALSENDLQDVSGGLSMSDIAEKIVSADESILNIGYLPNDARAFKDASLDDKLSLLPAFDNILNSGAIFVRSVYSSIKKFKEADQNDRLMELRKKRKELEEIKAVMMQQNGHKN